jgi:LysR family glycine cleavage system transcriptional activator
MSNRPLPPLATLQAFRAIAETGGFGRAADRLGLTQTAISHQIAQLEGWVGGRLFERGRRGAALSPLGRRLQPAISGALADLETALHAARASNLSPSLTISVPPEFSSQWLAPRLEEFCRRHPKIEVKLAVGYQRPDFSAGTDIAIWLGQGGPDLVAEPLTLDEEFVVCAPSLRTGLPKRGAIRAAPLLQYRGMRHTVFDWQRWYEQTTVDADGTPELAGYDIVRAVAEGPLYDTFEEMLDACRAGKGFALVRNSLVQPDLDRGRLVSCFVEIQPATLNYVLLYPRGALENPSVALFRRWLLAKI